MKNNTENEQNLKTEMSTLQIRQTPALFGLTLKIHHGLLAGLRQLEVAFKMPTHFYFLKLPASTEHWAQFYITSLPQIAMNIAMHILV